jgi:predicted short-subunit dehydrogenase-like oxidoreductase (DUF2520 family)
MDNLQRFAMMGSGALGSRLAAALEERGLERISDPGQSDVLFLCVPDDAIREVAEELAASGTDWSGRVVLHTSGAHDADLLSSLAEKGAETGSFHPVQTFPAGSVHGPGEDALALFNGIGVGIEGSERAVEVGVHLAGTLLAEPVLLTPEQKILYHTASVMAGNFSIALLAAAADVWETGTANQADFARALGPLVRKSVENALSLGSEAALSGPVSRGDIKTVEHQLRTLSRVSPHLLPLYGVLAVETVHLAQRAGHLSVGRAVEFLDLIHSFLASDD